MTIQATFSLEDDDPADDAVDEVLTVSVDFFSAFSVFVFSVEEPLLESLVLDSVAFAGVAEELPLRLSVR
jgi:hypothetical protein